MLFQHFMFNSVKKSTQNREEATMERSTNELLEILKSKKTYEKFFYEEVGELCFKSVSEYLELLLNEKHLPQQVEWFGQR